MDAAILEILTAAQRGHAMDTLDCVLAVAGRGLDGDRYTAERYRASPACQVTLIEAENIVHYNAFHAQAFTAADLRRNLVTRGIRLNDLVGKSFRIGADTVLQGLELCEPCSLLARRTDRSIVKGLLHRGGLRARILQGGRIRVGDAISVGAPPHAEAGL